MRLCNQNLKYVKDPIEFNKFTDKSILQYCLGATLYMPGTMYMAEKIMKKQLHDLTSLVFCFEDAIEESVLGKAQKNVLDQLQLLSDSIKEKKIDFTDIPLIFVRVRNIEQFKIFAKKLDHDKANILSGFVFPKFTSFNGMEYLNFLRAVNKENDVHLYAMPLLEGRAIAMKERRVNELNALRELLHPYKDLILNIRVGGTDISSLFGVRRGVNYSIYDILIVRDCLSDILNFFTRVDEDYVVSGPVWEYFLAFKKDDLDSYLGDKLHHSLLNRNVILNEAIDGLLREVILDKANGFIGKTIIHPSHSKYVNALQAVTKEEYDDAIQILETEGGVIKSNKANKMNEINPHRNWAKRIVNRAKVYGVIENEDFYLKLFMG